MTPWPLRHSVSWGPQHPWVELLVLWPCRAGLAPGGTALGMRQGSACLSSLGDLAQPQACDSGQGTHTECAGAVPRAQDWEAKSGQAGGRKSTLAHICIAQCLGIRGLGDPPNGQAGLSAVPLGLPAGGSCWRVAGTPGCHQASPLFPSGISKTWPCVELGLVCPQVPAGSSCWAGGAGGCFLPC